MRIVTVVEITATELEEIICKRFGLEEFITVADQEAGNEVLVREASDNAGEYEYDDASNPETTFMLDTYLSILSTEGLIPAGTYNIDCTW
tara:strand:+ start:254 stop:523 length:270 start_codon:yes stop_codon:yes gene_type:complete